MTAIQICALIGLIVGAALIYWTGYRGGLLDGRAAGQVEGIEEGKAIQRSDSSGTIRDLSLLLNQSRASRKQLYVQYERALAASKLGEKDRDTLLTVARQLQLAAETFKALKSTEQEIRSHRLRTKTLEIAALLDQAKVEDAA
ncbi:hypothetical protein [Pseudomonas alvandae]|uniref:hypothetical protein n=1 Tax=Pseudomonas canavaninivorans TaxID=2842348 RepID=UPI002FF122E7